MQFFRVSFNNQQFNEYLVIAEDREAAARAARLFESDPSSHAPNQDAVIPVSADQNASIATTKISQSEWQAAVDRLDKRTLNA